MTDEQAEYLAEHLFGRESVHSAPEGNHCLSATDEYGSPTAGPWFRYEGDAGWSCELCWTDKYLDEHGDKYLLSGNGMLEIIEAMREMNFEFDILVYRDGISIRCSDVDRNLTSHWADLPQCTLPEAVIKAAYSALKGETGDQ